jgi:hypothetical protein
MNYDILILNLLFHLLIYNSKRIYYRPVSILVDLNRNRLNVVVQLNLLNQMYNFDKMNHYFHEIFYKFLQRFFFQICCLLLFRQPVENEEFLAGCEKILSRSQTLVDLPIKPFIKSADL